MVVVLAEVITWEINNSVSTTKKKRELFAAQVAVSDPHCNGKDRYLKLQKTGSFIFVLYIFLQLSLEYGFDTI